MRCQRVSPPRSSVSPVRVRTISPVSAVSSVLPPLPLARTHARALFFRAGRVSPLSLLVSLSRSQGVSLSTHGHTQQSHRARALSLARVATESSVSRGGRCTNRMRDIRRLGEKPTQEHLETPPQSPGVAHTAHASRECCAGHTARSSTHTYNETIVFATLSHSAWGAASTTDTHPLRALEYSAHRRDDGQCQRYAL